MAWRLARSLESLRAEVNAAVPNRSKASDGTLGDPAHAARASRHNPNDAGVVCAIDLTHDPRSGCDIHALARRLVLHPHPNLEYVISNGQVAKRRNGFRWEPYTGSNRHDKHAHFAVGQGPDSEPTPPYDDTDPWGVADTQPPAQEENDDMLVILAPGVVALLHSGKLVHIESTNDIPKGVEQWDLTKPEKKPTWDNLVKAYGAPIS